MSVRTQSLLGRLVEREERWEVPDRPQDVLPKIGMEPSKIVLSPAWCSKLRLTTGVKNLALGYTEFRGP
ncbi:hypothetical protein TNCV_1068721 [Trichonephila clavipes]|nr:hypothetical protein TNCV_1068721 [Trichonephila clavipes]